MKPQVIIIGRPNVGKSTLFNRLVGKKLALVDDQPGVTRDRRMGDAELAGLRFTVVDTAGWEDEDELTLPGRMRKQTEASLEGADAAMFVVDARAGLTPLDNEIARYLREHDVPIVLVANKLVCLKRMSWDLAILYLCPLSTAKALRTCLARYGPSLVPRLKRQKLQPNLPLAKMKTRHLVLSNSRS